MQNNIILLILFAIIALSLFNCASGSELTEGYHGRHQRRRFRGRRRRFRRRHYPYWYSYYYNQPIRYYWWNRLQQMWPYGNYTPNFYYY